jgi:hypothetical protein
MEILGIDIGGSALKGAPVDLEHSTGKDPSASDFLESFDETSLDRPQTCTHPGSVAI